MPFPFSKLRMTLPSNLLSSALSASPAARAALRRVRGRLLAAQTAVDGSWREVHQDADKSGATCIYVLRNPSLVDLAAVEAARAQVRQKPIGFSSVLETSSATAFAKALRHGDDALVFLRKPPEGFRARGELEHDELLTHLFNASTFAKRPIFILPLVVLWSHQGETQRPVLRDVIFGSRAWPGQARSIAQFALAQGQAQLFAGPSLDLAAWRQDNPEGTPSALAFTLLARIERERRAAIGPRRKDPDRLRAEVIRSPKLQATIKHLAHGDAESRTKLTGRALGMLEELEARLDPRVLMLLDRLYDRSVAKMVDRIDVDEPGLRQLRECLRVGTVVLLPSHRSHLDYMVMSKVLHDANLPPALIAAGDNLNFFPAGPILRRAGAFFIRRSFQGDRLYGAVVDAYMRRVMRDGHLLAFFPEGQRSRTGKLLSAKLGLLSMVIDAAIGASERPVYFCPVSISYERTPDESAFAAEAKGAEKVRESAESLVSSLSLLSSRFGRVSVQLAKPFLLEEVGWMPGLTPAKRRSLITKVGHRVMADIADATAVTPGSLVAMAMLGAGSHGSARGVAHDALEEETLRLANVLRKRRARVPSLTHEEVTRACQLFVAAGHVECFHSGLRKNGKRVPRAAGTGAWYTLQEEGRSALNLAKNSLLHFVVERSILALSARLQAASGRAPRPAQTWARGIAELLQNQFSFRQNFEDSYALAARELCSEGLLSYAHPSDNPSDVDGSSDLLPLVCVEDATLLLKEAAHLRALLESYRIAGRSLQALLKESLPLAELTRRALASGEDMYLAGEVVCSEAILLPVLESALTRFVELGWLIRDAKGRLALSASLHSVDTVLLVEAQVSGYLQGYA
jgi:glycerol-3-phosphate O-acyltransferase